MLKEMLASLLLFFSSFFTSPTDVQVDTSKATTKNYFFEYTTPTTIKAYLDVSNYKDVDTQYAQKSYILKNVQIHTGQCLVQSSTLGDGMDIGKSSMIRFTITLQNPCKLNQFTLDAIVEMNNRVVSNGKVYEARKEEKFGPITFVNKNPFKAVEYLIRITPIDNNATIAANSDKEFFFQIKDKEGHDIDNNQIESVTIRALDAQKLALRSGDTLVNQLSDIKSAAGKFTLHAYERLGKSALELKAKVLDPYGFVEELREVFYVDIVQNEELDLAKSEYRVVLRIEDQNDNLLANERKRIEYQILNDKDEEIPDSAIESLYIRSYNGRILKLLQRQEDGNEILVNELTMKEGVSADGSFIVQAGEQSGSTKVEVTVTFNLDGAKFTKTALLSLNVETLPEAPYKVVLRYDAQSVIVDRNHALRYAIVSKTTGNLIQREDIELIRFRIDDGKKAVFVDSAGEECDELVLDGNDTQSKGFVFLRGKERGSVKIHVEVKVRFDAKLLSDSLVLPVVFGENNRIVLEYSGTEYNQTSGYFIDTYTLKIKDREFDGQMVQVGAITPKILYPQIYYTKFLEGKLDLGHPEYFQNLKYIYYRDIGNSYDGELLKEGDETFFSVSDAYVDRRLSMYEVVPGNDKLVILPNKMSNDRHYLGLWEIADVESDTTLLVRGGIANDVKQLSYVIGDESRYNPSQDTIASLLLDRRDGRYLIQNGEAQIRIYYPTFFAGKDVFISATLGEGEERIGNVYKRTLTGTKLEGTQPTKCKSYVCARKIKLYYPDANKPLQYARFAARCEGDNIRYLYFTSTVNNCTRTPQNGFENIQITNGNGDVIMCIYPSQTQQQNSTNTLGATMIISYEEVTPTCEYTVAEEFPY